MLKKREPVRLAKKEERKPLIRNGMIFGIPVEFLLITVIMISFFLLIILFLGPCTESGLVYNRPHY